MWRDVVKDIEKLGLAVITISPISNYVSCSNELIMFYVRIIFAPTCCNLVSNLS
jgi:hypothetical protein